MRSCYIAALVPLSLVAFAACGGSSSIRTASPMGTRTPSTYEEVVTYCAAVDTVDEPDGRWLGSTVPSEVIAAATAKLGTQIVTNNPVLWRCLDHAVVWCMYWGTNYCPKGDLSKAPTATMRAECIANANLDDMGRVVPGPATVWKWICRDGVPVVQAQRFAVDSRGFHANVWHVLTRDASDDLVPTVDIPLAAQ
jgi:hypothetical protein